MANKMRWRYGDTNPVQLPVLQGYIIDIGDLIYLDAGSAKSASSMFDQGTLSANQEMFHDSFVGVAMQASPADSTQSIRIATSGVFDFDCTSATFELGDLIGTDEDGIGTKLEDGVVIGVATPNLAVGRCAKRSDPAGTRVLVDIASTVMTGGPQAVA